MSKVAKKTPFELHVEQVMNGEIEAPTVYMNGVLVPYFPYQLDVHRFNLKIMAGGIGFKQVKFSGLKRYYGLKGRSAKECLPQFEEIRNKYLAEVAAMN